MGDDKNQTDLAGIRVQIDHIDEQIQKLISARAELAFSVGQSKRQQLSSSDYYRPEREAQVMRKVMRRNKGPLSDEQMVRLFREIISACLAQQEPLKIAYLGPEGTFTQQAVNKHFGHSIHALSMPGIEMVFQQVERGEADFGVVPVENSSQGAVSHTLDMFLTSPLFICGEVELHIHQNLISCAGSIDQIERVYSHQQSLSQCRTWLRSHLPKAELIAVSSNAEAVRRVRNAADAAAIAGRSAAKIYALPIMFANIEDQPDNTTRFLVIGRETFAPSGADKTTLLLAGHEGPGALYTLLRPFAEHRINMTRIESRPSRLGKWDYVFFIDVEAHAEDPAMQTVMSALNEHTKLVRVLGTYPQAMDANSSPEPATGRAESEQTGDACG